MTVRDLLTVAVGAGVGGVLRYVIAGAVQQASGPGFPSGTLAVNIAGGLLLGVIVGLAEGRVGWLSPTVKLLLAVGLCGGFTTFSTFALDTVALVIDRAYLRAGLYLLLSNGLTLAALVVGRMLAASTVAR